ncbi:hypothetical protein [Ramlibacter sp. WS9]|uniref:hypothetical protein n=1 Tax=Ramlibacter sp. WS9 TaxID=1882741 RepID=UPI001141182D|nr:hypothetical protein [Ramlibacter sp. WS9]ROZ69611.1 hypothetical protein EEB15_22170 [Ramlibacter sp. WS9]
MEFFNATANNGAVAWEQETLSDWSRYGGTILMCFPCWAPLATGNRVTLRTVPVEWSSTLLAGQEGIVQTLCSPRTVLVRFDDVFVELRRESLYYVMGQARESLNNARSR